MPCRLLVTIKEARALPVMDKASESTDAYVEVKFASQAQRTTIFAKSLNPVWKQTLKFEVTRDKKLHDCTLDIRVFDHDVLHDDIIGTVNIDISSLLVGNVQNRIAGWFPLFDTIRGVRGSIRVLVDLQFLDNSNKFKDNAAGVHFYSVSKMAVENYAVKSVLGFVEELVVEDDPVYIHWTSFRNTRNINESRQGLMYHISGKLRRKIGILVQEMGGNAVLGFKQYFDFEGEGGGGIVARACGTACIVGKENETSQIVVNPTPTISAAGVAPSSEKLITSPLMTPVDGNISTGIQLITLTTIPSKCINVNIGGIVMCRAVKLMKNTHRRRNRDKWWSGMRAEIQSHAQSLECNIVLGYRETTTILGDTVILTAYGTACRIIPEEKKRERKKKEREKKKKKKKKCSNEVCHIPFSLVSPVTSSMRMTNCKFCKNGSVPEILLTSIDPPSSLQFVAQGNLLQARVARTLKKKAEREANATMISKAIPFLEYDLHRQIIYKMKILKANACFAMHFQIALGDNLVTLTATGTAMQIGGLPAPFAITLSPADDPRPFYEKVCAQQAQLKQTMETGHDNDHLVSISDDVPKIDDESTSGFERPVIVEVSENKEMDTLANSLDPPFPAKMNFCTTMELPNGPITTSPLQYFVQFLRVFWDANHHNANEQFSKIIQRCYNKLVFQMCNTIPCTLCGFEMNIQIVSENQIDFLLSGMILESEIDKFDFNQPDGSSWDSPDPYSIDETSIQNLEDKSALKLPSLRSSVARVDRGSEKMSDRGSERSNVSNTTLNTSQSSQNQNLSTNNLSGNNSNSKSTTMEDVIITNLDYIPSFKIKKYYGRISHHLIKENKESNEPQREIGGSKLGYLANIFLRESLSIARAHALAMGGNAIIGFQIDHCLLISPISKTGYCLISFSGDVVAVAKPKIPIEQNYLT